MTIPITAPRLGLMRSIITGFLTLAILSGCGGSSSSSQPATINPEGMWAVVATNSPDYSSGQVELVALDVEPLRASRGYHETFSDISVRSSAEHYYLVERAGIDRISKIDVTNPGVFEWQYHSYNAADTGSPNPYDLVFVSEHKAYLLRYDADTAWIVNPAATDESDFLLGELDLSAYTADGSNPNMSSAVIIDDRLFIAMQRLDAIWNPTDIGYVAVFDVNTDEEIDTGHDTNGLKGIPLIGHNPLGMSYHPEAGLLVQSVGEWFGWSILGGIDVIDPDTFQISQVLKGTDEIGRIEKLAVVDANTAYISVQKTYGAVSVLRINPRTGQVLGELEPIAERDLRTLAVDPLGRLWIGDAGDNKPTDPPGIRVIDPRTDQEVAFIRTDLLPIDITFVTED